MSTMSVVSNSSVEVDSDSSNDISSKDEGPAEQKFILRNELYNSLLASALGKTVLNRHLNFKEQGINFNLANLKDNLNALGALKELKDLKGLTVSSVPAFPRNLALHREDHDEIIGVQQKFAESDTAKNFDPIIGVLLYKSLKNDGFIGFDNLGARWKQTLHR
ncbi:uncharacterized protein LOC143260384 [Megalopta genalis]|uniref:uncharacterized protein LOC143260384 n=1 Tax=Megalopta genalis TaxID=115081 RepID=UPI003FD58660